MCAPSRRDVYSVVRDELQDDRWQSVNEGKASPKLQGTDAAVKEEDGAIDMEEDVKMEDENSNDVPLPRTRTMSEVQSAEESDDDNDQYKTISSRVLAKVGTRSRGWLTSR